jgi:hypothetical protein
MGVEQYINQTSPSRQFAQFDEIKEKSGRLPPNIRSATATTTVHKVRWTRPDRNTRDSPHQKS